MTARSQQRETGSALVFAIIAAVLVVILIAVISSMLDFSGQRSKNNVDRSQNVAVVDRAISSYEYALESNLTNEFHGFRLSSATMTQLATESGATPVANASFGAEFRKRGLEKTWMTDPGGVGSYTWSMQNKLADGRSSWWQLVNAIPPNDTNASLVAYIRTWISAGGASSAVVGEPRIVRAELRPGRFSDYQMLVDGPVVLGGGTNIQGRIHSNGYPDAYLVDAFTTANAPLKLGNAEGSPTCSPGASFSTSRGSITGACPGAAAPRSPATGKYVDLLRGHSHLLTLKQMCGAEVVCPGGTAPWRITLSGSTARFTPTSGATVTVNAGAASAVYIEGEASISGQLSNPASRLTIGIANQPGTFGTFGSASLSLLGNGVIGATNGAVLGLIVDGDVIPRIDLGQCPTGLNAALVSASGALTFPPQYRVPVVSSTAAALPMCGSFTFFGSMGTHYAPLLYLAWGAPKAGYAQRSYRYDVRLRRTPPPLFPLTGPWQVSSWRDAMPECLAPTNRRNSNCG